MKKVLNKPRYASIPYMISPTAAVKIFIFNRDKKFNAKEWSGKHSRRKRREMINSLSTKYNNLV